MARNADATAEVKLAEMKNTTNTIVHSVGDSANTATRKSPGSGSKASGPFPFAEISLVATSVQPLAAKEVAVWHVSLVPAPGGTPRNPQLQKEPATSGIA